MSAASGVESGESALQTRVHLLAEEEILQVEAELLAGAVQGGEVEPGSLQPGEQLRHGVGPVLHALQSQLDRVKAM